MVRMLAHGGACCGIRHIAGFNDHRTWPPKPVTEIEIKNQLYTAGWMTSQRKSGGRTRGKVVEAVVTDRQFRSNPDLAQILHNQGFQLVTRFYNSTGGICNILHRVGGGRDFVKGRQPEWVRILREKPPEEVLDPILAEACAKAIDPGLSPMIDENLLTPMEVM